MKNFCLSKVSIMKVKKTNHGLGENSYKTHTFKGLRANRYKELTKFKKKAT